MGWRGSGEGGLSSEMGRVSGPFYFGVLIDGLESTAPG